MKVKPLIFSIFVVSFIGIAFSIPIQIMAIYGHGLSEIFSVFTKVSNINWLVIFFCLSNAYLANRADAMLRYTFPISLLIIATNNLIVSTIGNDFSSLATALATCAYFALYSLSFTPKVRYIFKHPEKRWWFHKKRYRVSLDMYIKTKNAGVLQTKTFDLSGNGAFIPYKFFQSQIFPKNLLHYGEDITIDLISDDRPVVSCNAKVIRKSKAQGSYPAGIGLKLLNAEKKLEKFLRREFTPAMAC